VSRFAPWTASGRAVGLSRLSTCSVESRSTRQPFTRSQSAKPAKLGLFPSDVRESQAVSLLRQQAAGARLADHFGQDFRHHDTHGTSPERNDPAAMLL
jgi:hypothetical protein